MPTCLKPWKGCSGGDRQSIASFLGTGGATQFGKQEAALHYPQRLYWFRCCICVYCHFRDWMLKTDWLHPRKSPNIAGFHFAEQVLRKVGAAGKSTISLSLKKAVGEAGDFCFPHRSTLQSVAPPRVLVSSPRYLPSPFSPCLTVCVLIYVADKIVELVWDFFPFVGGKTPPVEERAPLLHLRVVSKGAV